MKISFIGGGNMASAMIGGLLAKGAAPDDIVVAEPDAARRAELASRFAVRSVAPGDAAIMESALIVLAVKPQQMQEACRALLPGLHGQLVLSIAAGLRLDAISRWLNGHRQLVRAMPNTPALIGAGISGLYAFPEVDAAGRSAAEALLAAAGRTLWVADEAALDAVTAISGSGPAYFFLFIEALEKAGGALGLTAADSRLLAVETALGAARLAAGASEDPATLRARVTSKGGTTAAALAMMEECGVSQGIIAGALAAGARSRELGDILSQD